MQPCNVNYPNSCVQLQHGNKKLGLTFFETSENSVTRFYFHSLKETLYEGMGPNGLSNLLSSGLIQGGKCFMKSTIYKY